MSTVEDVPDTAMYKRFGHLKGKDVKTVSETIKSFCIQYQKPILPQYRTMINDVLQSTHLNVVNGCFIYDAMFGYGFYSLFYKLMKAYPGTGEADLIYAAMVTSLDMEPEKLKEDHETISKLIENMTRADLENSFKGENQNLLSEISSNIKADEFYLYTKTWGIGLIEAMDKVGIPLTEENIESLANMIGFSPIKARQDLVQYKDVLDKVAQAEQLFKEIEIREKKKMAERLEEKAKRALEAAKKAEESQ
uniref:Uncharacterized protein n=1 Tax=Vaucheria litorea TaxID=109269 RepID=H6WBA6_VAULI|nr:hypothetical protein [Vaucheria litorea]